MTVSSVRSVLVAVSVALALALGHDLFASLPTVKGKGRLASTFEKAVALGSPAFETLYTVPANRTLVLTDVVVGNTAASTFCQFGLVRVGPPDDAEVLATIRVPVNETFDHLFGSGIEFGAGAQVIAVVTSGSAGLTLRGYLRKN